MERGAAVERFCVRTRALNVPAPHERGNAAWTWRATARTAAGQERQVNTIALILIIATLALFTRVWVPGGERASGNLVRRVPLSVLGRLRMHGPAMIVMFIASVVALAMGWISPLVVLVITGLLALLLALPISYTVTSRGIRAGWTPFRRWTEFGGVARRRGGVRLQGVAGARPQTVWLSGGRDDDDFVLLLRQLVRGSYKGHLGPEAATPIVDASPSPSGTGPIGIAGAGGD
jgi:hypothetical protein